MESNAWQIPSNYLLFYREILLIALCPVKAPDEDRTRSSGFRNDYPDPVNCPIHNLCFCLGREDDFSLFRSESSSSDYDLISGLSSPWEGNLDPWSGHLFFLFLRCSNMVREKETDYKDS